MMGVSSPGNSYLLSSSRISISTSSSNFGVVTMSPCSGRPHDDVRHTDLTGQQDVLAGLGIGPSAAEHTRIAPSIWAAPVIMFFT